MHDRPETKLNIIQSVHHLRLKLAKSTVLVHNDARLLAYIWCNAIQSYHPKKCKAAAFRFKTTVQYMLKI